MWPLSYLKIMRQLPETFKAKNPFNSPDNECSRAPGKLISSHFQHFLPLGTQPFKGPGRVKRNINMDFVIREFYI